MLPGILTIVTLGKLEEILSKAGWRYYTRGKMKYLPDKSHSIFEKRIISVSIFLLILIIASCTIDQPTLQQTLTNTSTKTIFPNATITQITQTEILPSYIPSEKTLIPPESTMDANPPRLSNSEKEAALRKLLKANSDCSSSCLFGIKRGVSTEEDLLNTFYPILGNASVHKALDGSKNLEYGFEIDGLQAISTFNIKNGIVNKIDFRLGMLKNNSDKLENWSGFTLHGIFLMYGRPSGINFVLAGPSIEAGSDPNYAFTYSLYYDETNTIVHYLGSARKKQTTYNICLLHEQYEYMTISISQYSLVYEKGITPSGVTSISVDQLYSSVLQNGNDCLVFSKDLLSK
jgi:hypothetical protein